MPIDRANLNNGRPLKPMLATNRTAKTPIAPRLAPSVASAASSQAGRTVRSNGSTTPRALTAAPEDITPIKAFLNNNITPRSATRKSRVGVSSTQSTPNTTPSSTRPNSVVDFTQKDQNHGYGGLGSHNSSSSQLSSRPRSVVGGNIYNPATVQRPPILNLYNNGPLEVGGTKESSPMFFHASEVRAPEQAPQKKAPVFFYANGAQDETSPSTEVPSPPSSAVGRPQLDSRFFHADSLSDTRGNPPILTPPPISASPDSFSSPNPLPSLHSLNPPSAPKENIHLSYRKGVSQVMGRPNSHTKPSALSILSGQPHASDSSHDRARRRSSAASSVMRVSHGKSASLSSIDSVTSIRKATSSDMPSIPPSPLHRENRVFSNSSIPESVASAPPSQMEPLSGLPSPSLQSPTKSSNPSTLDRMNELAANARRERKVLDLEISNSSLLAINRSLEKEVKKQKAELRRFRRMSRAGRFSTDTSTSKLESFSAIGASELGDLSDMSEEDELAEDDPESSSESSFDETTMSPTTLAKRDATHRSRDEKRLELDLSKHRGLLVDSQNMNQSLKRCLDWTEELIKDARKALAYQVRVSDVKLGGRVLSSEENPEVDHKEESRGLLSPWTPSYHTTDPFDLVDSERTDRDSGVDVDGLNPLVPDLPAIISPLGSPIEEPPSRLKRISASIGDLF
ncbi:hypothetical protein BDV95DRAFT_133743 [Massariosphaeria phaeospora]|uniref:Uncharacterized protein n=1 Tax=Massariosphaeria phaeospora TaxID=100035 RepID=A0A7C8MF54_9PLEO|nr:hypothetical protein BDV95DRAFT_133743 [Massariosphaeria phaeospora]